MATTRCLRRGPLLHLYRSYSAPAQAIPDVRTELTAAVKAAMKKRDTQTSTTLRAILAEVYSADKAVNGQVASGTIVSILRKAATRRVEAATRFTEAARPDLAEKESAEANLLSQFLPPLLSESQVDSHLKQILADSSKDAASPLKPGNIFKVFYTVVDKSTVDSEMVKKRLDALISGV